MVDLPNLHNQLFESLPKKRGRKKEGPTPEDILAENISGIGPILTRALTTFGDYTLVLKSEQALSFNHCHYMGTGEESFITLYRKKSDQWEIIDVSVEDISYTILSMPLSP